MQVETFIDLCKKHENCRNEFPFQEHPWQISGLAFYNIDYIYYIIMQSRYTVIIRSNS